MIVGLSFNVSEPLTSHLINAVIKHHGCPAKIIADNDTRLRAGFWEALTRRLGIQMRHISAYHPQSTAWWKLLWTNLRRNKDDRTTTCGWDCLRLWDRYGSLSIWRA